MIKEGGIYTRNEEIRVVFEVIEKDTATKGKVDEIIQEDSVAGFFIENYHSLFEEHFDDMNDGYLGQIDESLLIELQNNYFLNFLNLE